MALITCPQCGAQISDKSKTCIHCGYDLSHLHDDDKNVCPECGAELEEGATVCPNCGYPIEDSETESNENGSAESTEESKPQQVEVAGIRNGRKILIAIIAVVVVAGIAAFAGTRISKQNNAKRAEEYKENLDSVSFSMLTGALKAETAGDLITSVWSNCIYEKSDSATDKYTVSSTIGSTNYYYSDFNDALANLFSDSDFQDDLSYIESNQSDVKSMMKELKDPPDEWSDAYDVLQDCYDSYLTFTNMVLDPSGSLMTYSSNFNDADSALLSSYQKLQMYLE